MKTKWKGRITEEKYPRNELPENAKEIDMSKNSSKIVYAAIICVALALVVLFIKRKISVITANLVVLLFGLLASVIFLPIHELIHSLFIPKDNKRWICYMKAGFALFFDGHISKRRYLLVLLMPVIIAGILPLLLWLIIPPNYVILSSFIFAFSLASLGLSAGDLVQISNVIAQVPKGSMIIPLGSKVYYSKIVEN